MCRLWNIKGRMVFSLGRWIEDSNRCTVDVPLPKQHVSLKIKFFLIFLNRMLLLFCFLIPTLSLEITEIKHCDGFKCNDGTCLPGSVVCDDFFDCSDGSDESHCKLKFPNQTIINKSTGHSIIAEEDCIAPSWFKCPSGRCIPTLFVCDGNKDCEDFSDEHNCAKSKSNLSQKPLI